MIFLQTASGSAGGGFTTAVGILAVLLLYVLPVTILVVLGFRLLEA